MAPTREGYPLMIMDDGGTRQPFCVSPGPCRYLPAGSGERGAVLGCCTRAVARAARSAVDRSDPDGLADLVEEYGDLAHHVDGGQL